MPAKPSAWCWAQHQCSTGSCHPVTDGAAGGHISQSVSAPKGQAPVLRHGEHLTQALKLVAGLLPRPQQAVPKERALCLRPSCHLLGPDPKPGEAVCPARAKAVFPGQAAISDMDSYMQEQGKQRRPEADL